MADEISPPRAVPIAMAAIALAVLLASPARVAAQPADPLAVVTAFIDAQNARDVDATLALLDDNVVFSGSGGVTTGKAQIRPIVQRGAGQNRHIERVGPPQVAGDTVTQLDRVTSDENRQLGIDYTEYVDTFVVRAGKIVSITSVITPESDAKIRQALGDIPAGPPALPSTGAGGRAVHNDQGGWALALAGLAVLGGLGVGLRRRRDRRVKP